MSKNFLITSHTEGKFPNEQKILLQGLVTSLKKFFPDCFILLASQCPVSVETQQTVDYLIVDQITPNVPHGYGELELVRSAIGIMKKFNKTSFYKIVYDFIIDETNYRVFDQWLEHKKDFVSCYWRTNGLGVGTWVWYSDTELANKIFDFSSLNSYIECKTLESIVQKNLSDSCYLYKDHNEMFNGDWNSKCDLVHAGGKKLRYNYESALAVLKLTDDNQLIFLPILYSVLNQTFSPTRVLINDKRTNPGDLRKEQHYSNFFNLLIKNKISWEVIFTADENNLLVRLDEIGSHWCWLIESDSILQSNALKENYQQMIFNFGIGAVIDSNNNVFYKNRIVGPGDQNTDLAKYVVDRMKDSQIKVFYLS